jgi:hypothetical protein
MKKRIAKLLRRRMKPVQRSKVSFHRDHQGIRLLALPWTVDFLSNKGLRMAVKGFTNEPFFVTCLAVPGPVIHLYFKRSETEN